MRWCAAPRVAVDDWLVLLGDAAHSVIPPTGRGLNSGLEDTVLLAEHLASGSRTPFADYEAARMPHLEALREYACYLKHDTASDGRPGRPPTWPCPSSGPSAGDSGTAT